MTQVTTKRTVGRPKMINTSSFGTTSAILSNDVEKTYEYELIHTYDKYKPVEKNSGKPYTDPYPRYYGLANKGFAINPKTKKIEEWRFITGQPSIWASEQESLKTKTPREIAEMLGQQENQLGFIKGKLMVRGVETLKREALEAQDEFEGNTTPIKQKTKTFRLNNPDQLVAKGLSEVRAKGEAIQRAMECNSEEMVRAAFAMGINVDDVTDLGLKRIELEFLKRAETTPEYFLKIVSDPTNDYKYIFDQSLKTGIIVSGRAENKLIWGENNNVIDGFDINPAGDVTEQLTNLVIKKNAAAVKLYEALTPRFTE